MSSTKKSRWGHLFPQIQKLYTENPTLGYTRAAKMLLPEGEYTEIEALRKYISRISKKIVAENNVTVASDSTTVPNNYDEPVDQEALKRFCELEGIDFDQVESAKYITHVPGHKTFNVVMKKVKGAADIDWAKKAEVFAEKLKDIKPVKVNPKRKQNGIALALYFSDEHVGLRIMPNNLYNVEYNENIYKARMDKALEYIQTMLSEFPIDTILIAQLGDELDGFNGTTTRQTHPLPQNLSNEEQYDVWLESKIKFFESLVQFETNIEFVGMANSNHSGLGFSYMAFSHLCSILNAKYPHIKTTISRKFIEDYKFDDVTLLLTHGKDDKFMTRGWPLHVDKKIDSKIREYIDFKQIRGTIRLVKGDLHTSASDRTHKYSYRSVLSFAGDSDYSMLNFDKSCPGLSYDLFMGNGQIMSGDFLFNS